MSSTPEPLGGPSDNRPQKAVRTLLFWVLMILLAFVIFKMTSQSDGGPTSRPLNYSDFMEQVDKNNVAEGKFFMSQNTADFDGQLRSPAERIRATVPKDDFSALTARLRQQGARIEIAESRRSDWKASVANFAPLILLVAFWIFMMKRTTIKGQAK
ncbi:MAG: ATP-dependent metallopeptidase FtsH/Yme1/Tma family protein [Candidatus Acidiferrales bacterium]